MSIAYMSAAWRAKTDSPSEKLVLLKLSDHSSDDGCCWPSIRHIVEHTRLGRRTVIRAMKSLADKGWIVPIKRFDQDGRQQSNVFELKAENWECHSGTPEGGVVARGGCHSGTPEGAKAAPLESPEEPSVEPPEETEQQKKRSRAVREVFDYWREQLDHHKAQLGDDKRKKISARLDEGYTVDDLKQAVDGVAGSDWHRGANPRNRPFDSVDLIFRNSAKVDQFIALAEESRGSTADQGMSVEQIIGAAMKPDTPLAVLCAIEIGSWNLGNLRAIDLKPYAERCIAKIPDWKRRLRDGELATHEIQAMEKRGVKVCQMLQITSPSKQQENRA